MLGSLGVEQCSSWVVSVSATLNMVAHACWLTDQLFSDLQQELEDSLSSPAACSSGEESEGGTRLLPSCRASVTLFTLLRERLLTPGEGAMSIHYLVRRISLNVLISLTYQSLSRGKHLLVTFYPTARSSPRKQTLSLHLPVRGPSTVRKSSTLTKSQAVVGHQWNIEAASWTPTRTLILKRKGLI